jgi:LysM repeat protein/uncharacterized protein YkwD
MHRWFVLLSTCALAAVLLFSAFIPRTSLPVAAPSAYDLIAAVNELRASQGLPAYEVDGALMLSAQGQSDYLASISPNIGDGHKGPGGSTVDERAAAAGYPVVQGVDIMECWAWARSTVSLSSVIYDMWGDADHMNVMLHSYGKHVGAGVTEKDGSIYYILDVAAIWGAPSGSSSGSQITVVPRMTTTPKVAPVAVATPQPDGSITHVVEAGQALWSIAVAYGTTVEQLRSLNNLSDNAPIYVGETLLIRLPYTPTPSPTPTATPRPPTRTPVPPQPAEGATESTNQSPSSSFLANIDRQALGLVLILICGVGLVLVLLGALRREK